MKDEITRDLLQEYFDNNILNRDFIVKLAKDTSNDITTQYTGQVFRLLKNTNYDGEMTGIKNGVTYRGTWSCNESNT